MRDKLSSIRYKNVLLKKQNNLIQRQCVIDLLHIIFLVRDKYARSKKCSYGIIKKTLSGHGDVAKVGKWTLSW